MSNILYDTGRDAFANGNIDWVNDDIRGVLVDTALYTIDAANDNALDDIAAGARIDSATLSGKTTLAGVCDALDLLFDATSGATVEAVVLYKFNATESLAQLIAYIDTVTGLPLTPGGSDVLIKWDNGANKIFKL